MPDEPQVNPEERLELLRQHLGVGTGGLASRHAQRRLQQYGPNEIRRRERRSHARDLARQFTTPAPPLGRRCSRLGCRHRPVAIAIVVLIVSTPRSHSPRSSKPSAPSRPWPPPALGSAGHSRRQ
jgi:hypothetical protein